MSSGWRELILFRHGAADPARGTASDFDRALSPAGRQVSARAAALLAVEPMPPTLLLYSTARRAAATAALLAEALALPDAALQPLEALYLATPRRIAALLEQHAGGARCVAVVGHNPGLSEFGALCEPRLAGAVLDTSSYWRLRRTCADEPADAAGPP